MTLSSIKISPILNRITSSRTENEFYTVCWIHKGVEHVEINKSIYRNVSNSVFFLTPDFDWIIHKEEAAVSSGYLLYLAKDILDYPAFKNLHITQVRIFKSTDDIPKINLSPGIEIRVQSILEMMDELISTNLAHKDEAILSLLNTLFVYCDGKCNIRTFISDNNQKAALVYRFKKLIDEQFSVHHQVASMLSYCTFQISI